MSTEATTQTTDPEAGKTGLQQGEEHGGQQQQVQADDLKLSSENPYANLAPGETAPEAKPEAKVGNVDPPDKGQQQQQQAQPSKKTMREELQARESELSELRAKLQALEDGGKQNSLRYEQMEVRAKDLEKQLGERDNEFVKLVTPKYDPREDKELASLHGGIRQALENGVVACTKDANAAKLQQDFGQILDAYHMAMRNPDINSKRNAVNAIKSKVTENFGDDANQVWSAVESALPSYQKAVEHETKQRENWMTTTAETFRTTQAKTVEKFSRIGDLPASEIEKAPDSAESIITQIAKANPQFAEAVKQTRSYYAALVHGQGPLKPDATPQEIHEYRKNEMNRIAELQNAPYLAAQTTLLSGIVARLFRENEQLRKRAGAAAAAGSPEIKPEGERGKEKSDPLASVTDKNYAVAQNPHL